MTGVLTLNSPTSSLRYSTLHTEEAALMNGDILIQTRSHTAWGGAVTAQLFLELSLEQANQKLTNYSQWVHYFPDLIRSEVLSSTNSGKQIYQVARKSFFLLTAQVEIYLRVTEARQANGQQIRFQMERGSFADFGAQLDLQPYRSGTILTYTVQATPTLPIPTQFIQEAMRLDLPNNLRTMRRSLCS